MSRVTVGDILLLHIYPAARLNNRICHASIYLPPQLHYPANHLLARTGPRHALDTHLYLAFRYSLHDKLISH